MLKKLLQYDMRGMKKLWKLLGIFLPCIAVAIALSIRFISMDQLGDEGLEILFITLSILTLPFGIAAIIVAGVFNSIHVAKRMGNDFFSDAGQLTFTLPVKRDDLFLSKFLNSLIWMTAYNLAVFFTVFVCMLIAPVPESGLISTAAFDAVLAFLGAASESGGMLFQFMLMLVVILILEINLFMATFLNWCVIKCQSAGGYGMYIGIMLGGIGAVSIIIAICSGGFGLITGGMHEVNVRFVSVMLLLAVDVILAILNFALFFSARDKLKYNFNLT